jgi:pilus assembly protein CpaB
MRVGTLNRILVAAICAAAATYLTVSYMVPQQAKPQLAVAQDVRPSPAPGLDTKTVVVAAAPLRFGTVLTADALAEVQWPAASVPPGAFTSRDALLGPGGKRTVLASISKSEPVLSSKITGPGQRGSLSAVIEDDKRAITVRVDDVVGVAGFVQPDDRVDVLWTRFDRPASGKLEMAPAYTDVLLQNVRVLAVDQLADRGSQAKPAKAVTVEVTAQEAQKVALASQAGQLSLALRQSGSSVSAASRRINLDDLGSKDRRIEVPGPAKNSGQPTVVTVTRGASDRSLYEITPTDRNEVRLTGKGQQQSQAAKDAAQLAGKPE